ncbi:PaaX family transcriptional regulator [Psychromonas ingrahamii]|nr:PaaX family transcriptional regulator C-terminal domain-containing protein [Psychromonas ingrahamii]
MKTKLNEFFTLAIEHNYISGRSLVMTFLGDYLCHSDSAIGMSSLINFFESLGFNQRFVRSSLFRLKQDGWVDAKKVGRKSYYYMTPERFDEIREANKKIYNTEKPAWNGRWNFIHIPSSTITESNLKGKELAKYGFGILNKGMYIQADQGQALQPSFKRILSKCSDATILTGAELVSCKEKNKSKFVSDTWNLDKINDDYGAFVNMFDPIELMIQEAGSDALDNEDCFKLRLLLIHFYRRIIIRDPLLPDEFLPHNWSGRRAQEITINIYQKIHLQAKAHITEHGETIDGLLPLLASDYYSRFNGLGNI